MKRFNSLVMTRFILFCAVLLSFSACNKEEKVHKKNIEEIEQYLADNNLTAQKTESGLHYIITREGVGNHPTVDNKVTVNYKGYFTDKSTFDDGQNVELSLSGVVEGWQEGVPKLLKGGSGILLIPSKLGYGLKGNSSIPGESVIIFDIDLLDFK